MVVVGLVPVARLLHLSLSLSRSSLEKLASSAIALRVALALAPTVMAAEVAAAAEV